MRRFGRGHIRGSMATTVVLAFGIALSACSSGPQSTRSSELPQLVEVKRIDGKTVASINGCSEDPMFIIADATGPEVERFLMMMATEMAAMMGTEPEPCLDPDVRQAMLEERARHQAAVDEHLVELATRCEDVFVKVNEPNVYERHTVCPDDPWATLPRTHKCDELIILGETVEPSFQCRPVIEPPS